MLFNFEILAEQRLARAFKVCMLQLRIADAQGGLHFCSLHVQNFRISRNEANFLRISILKPRYDLQKVLYFPVIAV